MNQNHMTDPGVFLSELEGGTVEQQLQNIISKVAAAAIDHGKTGKIKLSLDLERVGEATQVTVKHKLEFTEPTHKGAVSEHATGKTVMHVAPGGKCSLYPHNQIDMFATTEDTTNA